VVVRYEKSPGFMSNQACSETKLESSATVWPMPGHFSLSSLSSDTTDYSTTSIM
jgi:hypothetical protein